MSSYDPYERDYPRRYVREERREERVDPRFLDSRDYRTHSSRDLVPRDLAPPRREDSELSVEEIRRDFPPPTGREIRRARSAEPSYYDDDDYYDDYRRDRDYDRRSRRGDTRSSSYYDEERGEKKSKPKMSKEEKIIAAVAGAALLAGGKELYDRREAKQDGSDVHRNLLSSAALAGVGALAAYQGSEYYNKWQAKKDQKATYILHRGRDGQIGEYYSDDEDGGKEKKGAKNFLESAIAATGLGAAVKSFTGGGDKDKDDGRSDTRSRRGSRSRSQSRGGTNKMQKAAMASLLAGATEAFRVAKEPGSWKGEKTKRILTAAAGAATVDAAQDREHGKLGMAESVIGGLVGNRLINGSKNGIEEDKKTGRSRSRSRARSQSGGGGSGTGLAALATAGLGAFGAKKAYDGYQERSRSRRGRSADSRDGSPDRRRSRSRSVVDKARNSLAKLGIGGGAAAAAGDDDRRRTQDDFDDRGSSRRSRRYSDDMYDDDYRSSRGGGRDRDYYDEERSYRSGRRDRSRRRGGRSEYGSESDLGDSDEDEKRARKMKGKQLLTSGLATVATIHAVHNVYQSLEKRTVRQKAVREGRLSPEEAKKLKTKAIMQDAASVGVAALGVKSAIDEFKEAKHLNHECHEFQHEKALRHERREEKRRRLKENGGRQRPDSWSAPRHRAYGDSDDDDYFQPRYVDGNPYRANILPAPPVAGRNR